MTWRSVDRQADLDALDRAVDWDDVDVLAVLGRTSPCTRSPAETNRRGVVALDYHVLLQAGTAHGAGLELALVECDAFRTEVFQRGLRGRVTALMQVELADVRCSRLLYRWLSAEQFEAIRRRHMADAGDDMAEEIVLLGRSERIERDIVWFFHEQANYSAVMDDLDYYRFLEPYWDALVDDPAMHPDVQRGCLALLFAMGVYEAGCVGVALGDALPACRARLATFVPPDPTCARLKEMAMGALAAAARPKELRDRDYEVLFAHAAEVHRLAVQPYFAARAHPG